MHWAVLVLPPVLTVVIVAGVAFYQQMQLREQEQQYWAPFRQAVPASAPAQPRCCAEGVSWSASRPRRMLNASQNVLASGRHYLQELCMPCMRTPV